MQVLNGTLHTTTRSRELQAADTQVGKLLGRMLPILSGSWVAVGEWSTVTPTVSGRPAITVGEMDSISIMSLVRLIVGVILAEPVRLEAVTQQTLAVRALPGSGQVRGLLSRAGEERMMRAFRRCLGLSVFNGLFGDRDNVLPCML